MTAIRQLDVKKELNHLYTSFWKHTIFLPQQTPAFRHSYIKLLFIFSKRWRSKRYWWWRGLAPFLESEICAWRMDAPKGPDLFNEEDSTSLTSTSTSLIFCKLSYSVIVIWHLWQYRFVWENQKVLKMNPNSIVSFEYLFVQI